MRVFDLMLKDLSQIVRDRKSLLFLVLMPVVFTVFMGMALAPHNTDADARLPVAFVSEDGEGLFSQQLAGLLQTSTSIRLEVLQGDQAAQAQARVRNGELAGVVVVPVGYSAQLLSGQSPRLTLIADQNTAAGQTAQQVVQSALVRLLSTAEISRINAARYATVHPFQDDGERQQFITEAVTRTEQAWSQPAIGVTVQKMGQPNTQSAPSGFAQSSPGMLVQFAIFGLVNSAMILTVERKSRTLQRMLTTATSRAQIILGHLGAMFIVVLGQAVLLILVGQFGFGVNYLRQPLAVALVAVGLSLWVACLGLFIGVLARGEEQVTLWSLIAMFVFAALGGAMFPLEGTAPLFAAIGHLLPSAWAMTGLQNIVVRGLDVTSALLPFGVLVAYAAVFGALAVWRFRAE